MSAVVLTSLRHAELLHFIAQKESKCLELRSQLQIHEAELLQRAYTLYTCIYASSYPPPHQ